MTTARLWAPASPPILATSGINAASTTKSSSTSLNWLTAQTTEVEITTSKAIQGRRAFTDFETDVRTDSVTPAPIAAAKSSLASSWIDSITTSFGTTPRRNPLIVDDWYRQQVIPLDQIIDLGAVGVDADRDRVSHHHLFEADSGSTEDQVTKRDHSLEPPIVANYVYVREFFQFLMEVADPFDGLARRESQRELGDLGGHETAGGIRADRPVAGARRRPTGQSADRGGIGFGVVNLDKDVGRVLRAHFFEQGGGVGRGKLLQQACGHLGLQLDEDVGGLGRL